MSQHPSDVTKHRGRRGLRSWPWSCAAALVLLVTARAGGVPGLSIAEAQQTRSRRVEKPARTRMEYSQAVCLYTQMADVLNEREAKGWETFEIVPVHPANPGVG